MDIPEGAAIISISSFSVTLAGDYPDFAQTLYVAGAWFVLPANLSGCL
ncbi:hypothetical protein [Roseibium album]|nr:hypothetical protein [Roseibium album]MBG6165264.1 hypothetical protein [Labrenzia sp. EL_195]